MVIPSLSIVLIIVPNADRAIGTRNLANNCGRCFNKICAIGELVMHNASCISNATPLLGDCAHPFSI